MVTAIQGIERGRERVLGRDALTKKAGTSRESVRKLEAGVSDLTVGTLHRLATALGVQ